MGLQFITGNKGKFAEFEALLGVPVVQVALDLPEIQSLDPVEVMREKAEVAKDKVEGAYIIEDTGLTFGCLGGKLPGPFIKWFEEGLGNEKMAELAIKMGDTAAVVSTYIAYVAEDRTITFFEGHVDGEIVSPRGDKDFGYGPLFKPKGSTRTYGEMEREEKHCISSRAIAIKKLRIFLKENSPT